MADPPSQPESTVVASVQPDTLSLGGSRQLLSVRSFGLTDRGRVRENNEDQYLIATLVKALQVQSTSLSRPKVQESTERGYLFVVADGMGGQAGGEQASALAIDSVEAFVLESFKWFAHLKGREQDQVLADFQRALGHANSRVFAEGAQQPDLRGMATTLTLAYSLGGELFVAHVGDSRCYLGRGDILYRLTSDHTLVEDMVRQGVLSRGEADKHRWRHVVTNAVGGVNAEVKVEVHKVHLEAGDVVLLCSDGLTNMVPDEAIHRVLHAEGEPERACRQLAARANEAGGKDNITVVVARFEPAA